MQKKHSFSDIQTDIKLDIAISTKQFTPWSDVFWLNFCYTLLQKIDTTLFLPVNWKVIGIDHIWLGLNLFFPTYSCRFLPLAFRFFQCVWREKLSVKNLKVFCFKKKFDLFLVKWIVPVISKVNSWSWASNLKKKLLNH